MTTNKRRTEQPEPMGLGVLLILGAFVGLAFAILAIVLTPIVHADEGTYVNALDQLGVEVTPASIPLGHTICARIAEDGYDGVTESIAGQRLAGMSMDEAGSFVAAAVTQICPSQYQITKTWAENHQ